VFTGYQPLAKAAGAAGEPIMGNDPFSRDLANTSIADVDEQFYNDRLNREDLTSIDYPARVDQAAADLLYGVSIGKDTASSTGLSGTGTIGKFDFGRATGGFYKEGLTAIAGSHSGLPRLVSEYSDKDVGELAFRLNELQHKLRQLQRRSHGGEISDLNRAIEAVIEKVITQSLHRADQPTTRQAIKDPETVFELTQQIFSDPSATTYADHLITILNDGRGQQDFLSILDSPEMVTPLWDHQQEAIRNWVDHGRKAMSIWQRQPGRLSLDLLPLPPSMDHCTRQTNARLILIDSRTETASKTVVCSS